MQKVDAESSRGTFVPSVGEVPVPEAINTVIETYVATEEGHLKLTAFYVRVDRRDQDKSPLRRLIEAERR